MNTLKIKSKKELNKIKQINKILKDAGSKEIYLFGSFINGNYNKNSDIDIGVKGLPPDKFFYTHYIIEESLNSKVDLVDFDYEKDFFKVLKALGEIIRID